MPLLYAAIGALFLYFLQERLYRRFWDLGLTARIRFEERAVKEGDSCTLQEEITNQKWLPLPALHVKFQLHRNLIFLKEENIAKSDFYYKHDIFSVLPYQRITRRLNVLCSRRGYYEIQKVSLVSANLFFAGNLADNQECGARIYVYPKRSSLPELKIPFRKMMGTVLMNRRLYEDPFEFRGIRPYQSYDSMKDINWKASAKTGEWKVNQHHDTAKQDILILLNLEDVGVRVYEELKEESIRIAYTLLEWFVRAGIQTGILSNGKDVRNCVPVRLSQNAGAAQTENAARALARIDLSQKAEPMARLLEGMEKSQDTLLVMISSCQKKELQKQLAGLCKAQENFFWIAPVNREIERELALPAAACCYMEVDSHEKN